MPQLDLMDETFIVASPATVAAAVADAARWPGWWPELTLDVVEDRGPEGVRWSVAGERWTGTMEVWVEPHLDGVIAHYYLRVDPVGRTLGRRGRERVRRDWARHSRRLMWGLKDELEKGRPPGEEP
jgi:hypothetical protein